MTVRSEVDSTKKSSGYVAYRIGIFGWRKRCLYFLILLVLIMAVVNLALIIWIIRAQDFGLDGIGKLYITNNGIRMEGVAEFMASLKLKQLHSGSKPLQINSRQNLSLSAIDEHNNVLGQVVLDSNKIILKNKELLIADQRGKTLLYANNDKVAVNIPHMEIRVPGGGLKLDGHLKSSIIRKDESDLHLQSPTRKLNMKSEKSFDLSSQASNIRFKSRSNINMMAKKGKISLNAHNIHLRSLKKSTIMDDHLGHTRSGVSEVCMCKDGTLFLAPPHKMRQCKIDDGICL